MVDEQERRTTYISERVTRSEIREVRKLLNLKGTVDHHDRYLAAYHYHYPELVGNDNYKDLLIRRNREYERLKRAGALEESSNKKSVLVKKRRRSFDERVDQLLVDMENGDFSGLANLSLRYARAMQEKIMEQFDNIDELKSIDPIGHSIYTKLQKIIAKEEKGREKESVKKRLSQIQLCQSFEGIVGKDPSTLFQDDIRVFVFYDTQTNLLSISKVGSVNGRLKGSKTLQGEIKQIHVKPKILPDILTARTFDSMMKRMPENRKIYEVERIRLLPRMILLKAMKK